jgi:penicillin V acylase-like amidase (Ntn superfamily)
MDWGEDMHSNLWVFPRGMSRDGVAGPNSVKWTSKYGSLAVSSYEAGNADSMNEKGLVMNGLYLVESDYGKPNWPSHHVDHVSYMESMSWIFSLTSPKPILSFALLMCSTYRSST